MWGPPQYNNVVLPVKYGLTTVLFLELKSHTWKELLYIETGHWSTYDGVSQLRHIACILDFSKIISKDFTIPDSSHVHFPYW